MNATYVQGSKRAAAFMKALRLEPLTRAQLRAELGWHPRTVSYWVADMLAEGLVIEIDPPADDVPRLGPTPKLLALSPAWGGAESQPCA